MNQSILRVMRVEARRPRATRKPSPLASQLRQSGVSRSFEATFCGRDDGYDGGIAAVVRQR